MKKSQLSKSKSKSKKNETVDNIIIPVSEQKEGHFAFDNNKDNTAIADVKHSEADNSSNVKENSYSQAKIIAIIAVILIVGFALWGASSKLVNKVADDSVKTPSIVLTLDQLHEKNLAGQLSPERGYLYNGFSFVKYEGLWWTQRQDAGEQVKIPLHFGPLEVEDIEISGTLSESFNRGEVVYISIDPEVVGGHYVLAMRELSTNIAQGRSRNTEGACTKENAGCEDRRIVNCENQQGVPVIELRNALESRIELRGDCIIIQGQDYGIVKAVDRLLLQWYGIMLR